jgi:DNA-directed RNA polymerase I, II, and III subunit RPABC2
MDGFDGFDGLEQDDIDLDAEYNGEEFEEDEEATAVTEMKPELKKLYQQHPECQLDYVEQVVSRLNVKVLPSMGDKVDENHRTYPFLTQYERTKIIGLRANQLSKGSVPFISVPKHITDVRDIARLELEQKRLPYIIKRPLPNGTYEYWRLADLIIL